MKKVRSRTIAYKSGWLISKSKGLGLGFHRGDGGFSKGVEEGRGMRLRGLDLHQVQFTIHFVETAATIGAPYIAILPI